MDLQLDLENWYCIKNEFSTGKMHELGPLQLPKDILSFSKEDAFKAIMKYEILPEDTTIFDVTITMGTNTISLFTLYANFLFLPAKNRHKRVKSDS